MPLHTRERSDVGGRSADIAEHEMWRVYRETGDSQQADEVFIETYSDALVCFGVVKTKPVCSL